MKTTNKIRGPQLGINYIILQKVAQISSPLGRLLQSFHPEMITPSSVTPENSYNTFPSFPYNQSNQD